MSVKVRPLHDRLIVERIEETEQKVGSIIIPDTAKEKPQQGKVIAAGKGKVQDDGSVSPLDVKTGDTVLFGKYAASARATHPTRLRFQASFMMTNRIRYIPSTTNAPRGNASQWMKSTST